MKNYNFSYLQEQHESKLKYVFWTNQIFHFENNFEKNFIHKKLEKSEINQYPYVKWKLNCTTKYDFHHIVLVFCKLYNVKHNKLYVAWLFQLMDGIKSNWLVTWNMRVNQIVYNCVPLSLFGAKHFQKTDMLLYTPAIFPLFICN